MQQKIIIALDFNDKLKAQKLINQLVPDQCALKVGSEMFTHFGPDFVRDLVAKGFKVFLDLKFHDIPSTVAKACLAAAKLGVWMVNVHAAGGQAMLEAARAAVTDLPAATRPLLIAVTVLTSMQEEDLHGIGVQNNLESQVISLAKLAKKTGLDGVVASAFEVVKIKEACGRDFLTVTPGIRANSNQNFDQKRVVTAQQAFEIGSDYLVVGRPIIRAKSPINALIEFNSAITKFN